MSKVVFFKTGGKRDEKGFDFHFYSISPIALRRIAKVHYEGDTRYGDNNYRKGLPFSNIMNHLINHLMLYLEGDTSQDNLAKVGWAANTLMHFEETVPELNDLPLLKIIQKKQIRNASKKHTKRSLYALRDSRKKKRT